MTDDPLSKLVEDSDEEISDEIQQNVVENIGLFDDVKGESFDPVVNLLKINLGLMAKDSLENLTIGIMFKDTNYNELIVI